MHVELSTSGKEKEVETVKVGSAPVEAAVPVAYKSAKPSDGTKMSKVVILAKQEKFEVLKNAMSSIGSNRYDCNERTRLPACRRLNCILPQALKLKHTYCRKIQGRDRCMQGSC